MPSLTLHLLALSPSTTPETFLHQLRQSPDIKVILASRPRHIVVPCTLIDSNPLTTTKWDLLVLLQPSTPATGNTPNPPNPLPQTLHAQIHHEYRLPVGIPSRLLSTYPSRDKSLKQAAASAPLTGALASARSKPPSQTPELPADLLAFMDTLTRTHDGPVTMLNLLHFHPDGKDRYYQYGQAFIPVATRRGGTAKLLGNVLRPQPQPQPQPTTSTITTLWDEISLVHYPSIRHFCDMLAGEDYQAINAAYRREALRDTFLLCTTEFDVEGAGVARL